jgi:5S rRNA maturation endonuclease (ribonuclease M5)
VDFTIQSEEQKTFLAEATTRYKRSLSGSPGELYLEKRGLLTPENRVALSRFQIGYVEDPLPGHEWYQGWLSIPYLRKGPSEDGPFKGWSVATMKFRCIKDHNCEEAHPKLGKYMSHPGDTKLFNTVDLQSSDDAIAICEGEIDAITAHLCGIPAVAVPGVKAWKSKYYRLFRGYKTIWVFADGDSYGEGLAKELSNKMGDKITVIKMPDGEDVNSVVLKHGKQALLKGIGRE